MSSAPADQGGGVWRFANLNNGGTYYAIQSLNNVVSLNSLFVTLPDVPEAPRNVVAVSGNHRAEITFEAPLQDGGSPITGYEIFDSNSNLVGSVGADSNFLLVTGLVNGSSYTFTVKALNAVGSSEASAPSNAVTPRAPIVSVPVTGRSVEVYVNGKVQHIGTATVEFVNGQQVTTIAVDEDKLMQRVDEEGEGALISIPLLLNSDVVIGLFNGQMLKYLENRSAALEIRTEKAAYRLSAKQMNVDEISKMFSGDYALRDIHVKIEIADPLSDTIQAVEEAIDQAGLTMAVAPLNFKVSAVADDIEVELTRFESYVERDIVIPDNVDPDRITTGVVVEPDGYVRHVPTRVLENSGIYYARINSLTNSTYTLVWSPKTFKDMNQHWAKVDVNDMGSRLIAGGTGGEMFSPDDYITRAEFAAIVVRGLGMRLENDALAFSDVRSADWFGSAVQTAYSYGLINGFEDGTFRPNDTITREQAMAIIANAMKITGLDGQIENPDLEAILHGYEDEDAIADWAKTSVAQSVQSGIVSGIGGNKLAPKAYITRAEVATIVKRLLEKSELI